MNMKVGNTAADYAAAFARSGNYAEVAREYGVDESTVRKAVKRHTQSHGEDPALMRGMASIGLEELPAGAWVKTQEPDEMGRTYSFYIRPEREAAQRDALERITDLVREIPPVHLHRAPVQADPDLLGFIPLNDLHVGLYAWGEQTGYGDWDTDLACARLSEWLGKLVSRMPVCQECVLFYNGDTLHTNGNEPLTGTPGTSHILDADSRHFRNTDMAAAVIIATTDMAAQKHKHIRLVIKRGNHDEDAYLALLMAAKWRYAKTANVTVEMDPSSYWCYTFGKCMLYGHHGDKIKPADLVMKMAADHPAVWGATMHRYVWTAHLHHKASDSFHGAIWERASCLTAPDGYGSKWGNHAAAIAVVYHRDKGEYERYTVRP